MRWMQDTDPRVRQVCLTVRRLREQVRPPLSQEEMAHRAGITLRHYQRLEGGNENPTLTSLYRLADALNIEADTLLVEARKAPRP